MIFDAFCKVQLIFTNKFFLEQKYQINNQLPDRAPALCFTRLEFIQSGHSSARPGNAMATDKKQLAAKRILGRICSDAGQLGFGSQEMAIVDGSS